MGLLLQSDALRVLPLHERLACRYADAKPLQRKPWLCCSTKAARKCALLSRVKCTLDDAVDPPIQHPQYYTYDDPISGEPGPAFSSSRTNLPDKPFWSEDVPRIMRRSRATVPKQSSSKPKGKPGSRRRKPAGAPSELSIKASQQSVQVFEQKEEEDEDEYREEYVTYKDPDEKEPEKEPVKDLTPLPNEKLWYNWRKIPPEKEPWHDFSRPPSDNFAVMAAAAAKIGQIKLFGEKPTVTETTLARARKHALKKERLEMEKRRREEIGGLAYYSEWVKAWKKDTSKEAVKKHYEESGEDESVQLIKMFQHQTFAEYRTMMGTDPRIQRDPLAIRMTLEEKKAVWGGDPVYPTVNYYQDPNQKIDYRGPNFHEPTVSLFESLRKAGRLITREQLKKIHEEEAASQYAMERDFEDAIAGAVDIGEKEEDEKEGEGQEGEEQEGEEKEEEGEEEEQQQQEEGEEEEQQQQEGEGEREGGGGEEEGEGKGEEASTSASTSEQNNEDG